ncbi:MAG: glycine--tRNA ligase subunit beta [Thioalkalivibrionaceae bacterium]
MQTSSPSPLSSALSSPASTLGAAPANAGPAAQADFLFELGTEELPPKALPALEHAFREALIAGLESAGFAHGTVRGYAAPRRIAIAIESLAGRAADRSFERRGPAIQAAFDATGAPTRAALGFAKSCGVEVESLERLENDQGTWLVHRGVEPGGGLVQALPELIAQALAAMPIPKRMRWGASEHAFVRPPHWIVCLHGKTVLPIEVLGLPAGRSTHGHRFHAGDAIELQTASEYATRLIEQGHVVADFSERRERVRAGVKARAAEAGAQAVIAEDLLDEVTALTEWPVALLGRFDERYLAVPQEALISTMQDNQKYFPLVDDAGRMQSTFVVVANLASKRPESVIEGNERVLRPRFADAEFFWKQDRRQPLSERVAALDDIVFERRLGTLGDKRRRIEVLAASLADVLGADAAAARRAAHLCKADLVTQMVYEFPELQGTMGRYYASADGEPDVVATAIEQHYWPKGAGAAVPVDPVAQAVALADRFDTLVGIFAIGKQPSGSKDPFALRRAAIGVLRIVLEIGEREGAPPVALAPWLDQAAALLIDHVADAPHVVPAVREFLHERLKGLMLEQGIAPEVFEAVAATGIDAPADAAARMAALSDFRARPEAVRLAAANKRIQNLLRRATEEGLVVEPLTAATFDHQTVDTAEAELFDALQAARGDIEGLVAARAYSKALDRMTSHAAPVDRFFDEVMVLAEEPQVRARRLGLLAALKRDFEAVADLSRLATG